MVKSDLLTAGTAVVTGAARGIGEAIAMKIIELGGSVALGDIDEERGAAIAARLGDRAVFVRTDATSEADIDRLFAEAVALTGSVSAVFANAGGVGVTGPLATTSLADYQRTLDLLLTSVFLTFRAGVREMAPLRRGSLVATGSVAGVRGGLGPHIYTAAKHAVHGLVATTATEVAQYGLTANVVAPGGTVSGLSAALYGDVDNTERAYAALAASSSSGVPTTSDDVADAALALAYGSSRVNGACLVIDGADAVLGSSGRSYHAPKPATEGSSLA